MRLFFNYIKKTFSVKLKNLRSNNIRFHGFLLKFYLFLFAFCFWSLLIVFFSLTFDLFFNWYIFDMMKLGLFLNKFLVSTGINDFFVLVSNTRNELFNDYTIEKYGYSQNFIFLALTTNFWNFLFFSLYDVPSNDVSYNLLCQWPKFFEESSILLRMDICMDIFFYIFVIFSVKAVVWQLFIIFGILCWGFFYKNLIEIKDRTLYIRPELAFFISSWLVVILTLFYIFLTCFLISYIFYIDVGVYNPTFFYVPWYEFYDKLIFDSLDLEGINNIQGTATILRSYFLENLYMPYFTADEIYDNTGVGLHRYLILEFAALKIWIIFTYFYLLSIWFLYKISRFFAQYICSTKNYYWCRAKYFFSALFILFFSWICFFPRMYFPAFFGKTEMDILLFLLLWVWFYYIQNRLNSIKYKPKEFELQEYKPKESELQEYKPKESELQEYKPKESELQEYKPKESELQKNKPKGFELKDYKPKKFDLQEYKSQISKRK